MSSSAIRLISTDFDGTLIGFGPGNATCAPELARALFDFKAAGGLWAINTGRTLDHACEGVAHLRAPVAPDFLLTNERDVFCRAGEGWKPLGRWNQTCAEQHTALFAECGPLFRRIREMVAGANDVNLLEEDGHPVGLITTDEVVMDRVVALIDAWRAEVPKFSHQRNTVYLRFCHADYHKGAALGELCRQLGLSREAVFAVGDHFNDLSMLDGTHAASVACPANAIPEVRSTVRAAGGYVARASFGVGTAEALDAARAASTKKPATV